MPTETVNTVVPVVRSRKGLLVAGEPLTFKDASEAKRRAERLSHSREGALVFSRTGDRDFGEYSEPQIVALYGNVPPHIVSEIVPLSF